MSAMRRSGFTRAELLAVAAIIMTLASLTASFVHKVREAAARMECQNNLKVLGIATHNFHDNHGFLAANPDTIDDRHGTLQDLLQPYLE